MSKGQPRLKIALKDNEWKLRAINTDGARQRLRITIITHFLLKNWKEKSKYNVEISAHLMSTGLILENKGMRAVQPKKDKKVE